MATQQFPQIEIQRRDRVGTRYAARLRRGGRLPVVIYGHKQEVMHASVDQKKMAELLHGRAHIVEVVLDSQRQPVLVKDVQWDHLGSQVVHVDLARVDLTERIRVHIDLVLTGEAPGLKDEGAILERPVTELEVECLATQIPERVKVDVSQLKVGDTVMVKDLKLPEGVIATLDPSTVLATITVVKEIVVEAPVAEAATAEPELIGKKPEEGEAAEGAEAAPGAEKKEGAAPAKEGAGAKKEAAPKEQKKK